MKLRESHMPDEDLWESLLDVPLILERLEIGPRFRDVVELGCGYGTFSVPVARRISGQLHAFDIEPAMVARTSLRCREAGLHNVVCHHRDVAQGGYGLDPASVDACLLFNILHCDEPVRLLVQAAEVVRPGGEVLAIHWRHDPATPRGPSLDIRPRPEQLSQWALETGVLRPVGASIALPPWHYGWRFGRHV